MTVTVMDSDAMPSPLGPYSQAVATSGELIFISGQPGIDRTTGEAPADFERQARVAFENLASVVRAAGSSMSKIVKTTIYLADAGHFPVLNSLFGEYFPDNPPTRSVPLAQLPKGLQISIEAIAVRS
jgi:2-iminobutanoate/2-iminopropanoate deaminase